MNVYLKICLEHIEIDISGLKIHDSIHVKDLPLPPEVEMVTDGERGVLSILPPRKIEVEEVAPAAVAEPEVISKKSKKKFAEEGEKKEANRRQSTERKERRTQRRREEGKIIPAQILVVGG